MRGWARVSEGLSRAGAGIRVKVPRFIKVRCGDQGHGTEVHLSRVSGSGSRYRGQSRVRGQGPRYATYSVLTRMRVSRHRGVCRAHRMQGAGHTGDRVSAGHTGCRVQGTQGRGCRAYRGQGECRAHRERGAEHTGDRVSAGHTGCRVQDTQGAGCPAHTLSHVCPVCPAPCLLCPLHSPCLLCALQGTQETGYMVRSGYRMQGTFRVQGAGQTGCRVQGTGDWVQGTQGSGCRARSGCKAHMVQGAGHTAGCRVQGTRPLFP